MSGTSSPRSGRPLTTSYADLMKPDEDWRNLPDAAERRKIQNRLAQRAYRRNMRDRTKEVEKLKKQLQQLQEVITTSRDPSTTPPPEQESSGGRSPASSRGTPAPHNAEPASVPVAMSGAADGQRQMNEYVQTWSHPQGPEQQLSGLGLMSDGDTPMAFDTGTTFFTQMPAPNDVVPELSTASALGRRARAVTTNLAPSSLQHNPPPRSHSMSATFSSNCSSPLPWGINTTDGHEQIPLSAGFNMYSNGDELSLYHPESVYSLEDSLAASTAYATSPGSDLNSASGWSSVDKKSIPRPGSSSVTSGFINVGELPDMPKPLPETTAPLLHFAVAGGNLETLRLLLQRYDVSINGRDNTGYTALQRAVMCGRTDMAAMLLDRGATVEGDDSWTAHINNTCGLKAEP